MWTAPDWDYRRAIARGRIQQASIKVSLDKFHFVIFCYLHYFFFLTVFPLVFFLTFLLHPFLLLYFFLSYLLFYSYHWLPNFPLISFICHSLPFSCFPIFLFQFIIIHMISAPFTPPIITFPSFGLLLFFFFYFPLFIIFHFSSHCSYSLIFCHWNCCCGWGDCLFWFHFVCCFALSCQDLYKSLHNIVRVEPLSQSARGEMPPMNPTIIRTQIQQEGPRNPHKGHP